MSTSSTQEIPCSRCQGQFTHGENLVACSACGHVYHEMCWGAGERCATPGCFGSPVRQAGVARQMTSMPPPPPMVATPAQFAPGFGQSMIQMEGEKTLIVSDGTAFPPICIMTGKRNDLVKRKRNESWAPAWTFAFVLLGLLIFLILRLVLQKKATIDFYLDREYAKARMQRSIANTALFFVLFIGSMISFSNNNEIVGFLLFIASVFVPIIVFSAFIQLYTVVKIDKGIMKIKFRKPEQAQAIYNAAISQ